MSIVEVMMTVCLLASPAVCEDKKTVFGPFEKYQLSQEDCESNGLVLAKKFLEDNKEYAVTAWKCQQKMDSAK